MLFADDSFLFLKASFKECWFLKQILQLYEEASGQCVNFQKCAVSFSPNIRRDVQDQMAAYLGVTRVDVQDRYLGLPIVLGRNRSSKFSYIKDRLWKKLKGWKEKLLSAAGKEILIKVVGQSLPIYSMSCFILPKSFCEELHHILCRFWWGGSDDSCRIHWMLWENMCRPKEEGGLGFLSLYEFNLDLLAKQGWCLVQNPQSLASRLLKAKYFPHNSFW